MIFLFLFVSNSNMPESAFFSLLVLPYSISFPSKISYTLILLISLYLSKTISLNTLLNFFVKSKVIYSSIYKSPFSKSSDSISHLEIDIELSACVFNGKLNNTINIKDTIEIFLMKFSILHISFLFPCLNYITIILFLVSNF